MIWANLFLKKIIRPLPVMPQVTEVPKGKADELPKNYSLV